MEAVHHIIFYIVRQLHKRLMKTNLMKLIYLVDLECYKKMGKQATNFEYIYYKRGPWTSQFDKVLSDLEGFEIQSLRKEKVTSSGEYIIFNKGPKPRFEPSLPPDLLEIIDRFIYIFKEAPQKQEAGGQVYFLDISCDSSNPSFSTLSSEFTLSAFLKYASPPLLNPPLSHIPLKSRGGMTSAFPARDSTSQRYSSTNARGLTTSIPR
jgi:hypothetical protein